jgi:hypothetical protein
MIFLQQEHIPCCLRSKYKEDESLPCSQQQQQLAIHIVVPSPLEGIEGPGYSRREIADIFDIFCQAVTLLTIGLARSKVSEFTIYCEFMDETSFQGIDLMAIFQHSETLT